MRGWSQLFGQVEALWRALAKSGMKEAQGRKARIACLSQRCRRHIGKTESMLNARRKREEATADQIDVAAKLLSNLDVS